MIKVTLDTERELAVLEPEGPLKKDDFAAVGSAVDPLIEAGGELNGLIVHVEKFPGWDSFGGLVAHLKFVREHHRKVKRIAFATDSPLGKVAESVASHFVEAQVREFAFGELEAARNWVAGA